jgi:DnaJ-class molecular chaperone
MLKRKLLKCPQCKATGRINVMVHFVSGEPSTVRAITCHLCKGTGTISRPVLSRSDAMAFALRVFDEACNEGEVS